jgi:cytochrome c-type biogenesis protein CcmH/NrfG
MTPSPEARALLEEERDAIPYDWSDIGICLVCAVIVVALYAADKYFEERVTEQERIEHQQRLLQQPKFTEM